MEFSEILKDSIGCPTNFVMGELNQADLNLSVLGLHWEGNQGSTHQIFIWHV